MGSEDIEGAPKRYLPRLVAPKKALHEHSRAKTLNKADAHGSGLAYAHTVESRGITTKVLLALLFILLAAAIVSVLISPLTAAAGLSLAFTALICTQAALRAAAVLCPKTRFEIDTTPAERSFELWPKYTVLVPLKDEAHMVARLVDKLSKFEYPKNRLQIIFITEGDDLKTRRAVTQQLRPPFEQVVVPRETSSAPRTKPHALNIAMKLASGDMITIYDAEDAPHPLQLKTAALALEKNPDWGALQAPLDYFNADDTQLSRQFALEYAAQFHVWTPLMVRLGLPFPLGGTSNHIRRSALEDIRQGEMFWDSYNVTEDADLSFRLAAHGWNIGYITPATDEEAVGALKPWIHQRTRWMKGFMQSWLVHMDRPFAPGGWRGLKRQLTLQLTLGTVLLAGFIHTPICLAALAWTLFQLTTTGHVSYPPYIYVSLAAGYGSGLLIGAAGAIRAQKPKLLWYVPLMPFYWLLLAVPTWRAAVDYYRRPYYWAKTEHGVTAQEPNIGVKEKLSKPAKNVIGPNRPADLPKFIARPPMPTTQPSSTPANDAEAKSVKART